MKKILIALTMAAATAAFAQTGQDPWTTVSSDLMWKRTAPSDPSVSLYVMKEKGGTYFGVELPCKSTGKVRVFKWKTAEDIGVTTDACAGEEMRIRAAKWSEQLIPLPPRYSPLPPRQ